MKARGMIMVTNKPTKDFLLTRDFHILLLNLMNMKNIKTVFLISFKINIKQKQ